MNEAGISSLSCKCEHCISLSDFVLASFGAETSPKQKKHRGTLHTTNIQLRMLLQILVQAWPVDCSIWTEGRWSSTPSSRKRI